MSSVRVVVEDSLVELSSIKTGLPFSRFIDRILLQFRSYCSFASAAHDDGAPSPASQQSTCVVVVVVVGGDNQIIIYLCPPERFSQRVHWSCFPEGCARRERGPTERQRQQRTLRRPPPPPDRTDQGRFGGPVRSHFLDFMYVLFFSNDDQDY